MTCNSIKIPKEKNEEKERLIPRSNNTSLSYSSSGYGNIDNPYTGYNNNIGNMSCSLNTSSLANNQSQILHSPKPLIRTNSMASSSATASSAILFAASKISQPPIKPIPRTKPLPRPIEVTSSSLASPKPVIDYKKLEDFKRAEVTLTPKSSLRNKYKEQDVSDDLEVL